MPDTDLISFLKARLDEDNEVAQATRRNEQFVDGTDRWFATHGNAITSMAPHRAVAEVEAKRLILAEHEPAFEGAECPACWYRSPCTTVRLLALPYANHKDFREEWRP